MYKELLEQMKSLKFLQEAQRMDLSEAEWKELVHSLKKLHW